MLELDSVHHRDGWTTVKGDEFREAMRDFAVGPSWVIDGNYASHGAREEIWPRADTIVWMDPPRRVAVSRVVKRTLKRVITREELWNGVTEPWTNLYSPDPDKNIVVWTWSRFDTYRERYTALFAGGSLDHANTYRIRGTGSEIAFWADVAKIKTPSGVKFDS